MQVNVTPGPNSTVELDIEVPAERVERAVERAFQRLAPQVRVAGFRPGRAPRAVLEQRIGWPLLRQEAIDLLLPEALTEAVTQQGLIAVDTPHVDIEVFERLQPARFRATLPVKPQVRLPDHRAIRAPLPLVAITSEQVDEAIQGIRESFAVLAPVEDRPVRSGDQLVVDLTVLRDGQPAGDPSHDMELRVNPETLLPGLFEGVEGMARGETRDIPLHLPDDYGREELAGQDAVFRVTVKEIKERVLPEVDDELARQAGAGETVAELRRRVEERLRAAAERDAVFGQQKQALDQLLAGSEFEVPEAMVEQELDRELRNLAVDMEAQGIDFDKLVQFGNLDLAGLRQERREGARERVRQELVLEAVAAAEGLEPSDAHVAAEARRQLSGGADEARLLASERVREYVRERMRLQWALLWLSANAQGGSWTPPEPEAPEAPAGAVAGEIVAPSVPQIVIPGAAEPEAPEPSGLVEI
jgi:trigger factor